MLLERWSPRKASVMEWDPFTPLAGLTRVIDEVLGSSLLRPSLAEARWTPRIDVYETGDAFVVKADVPGVKAEDIDLSILGDVLTIRGERKHEAEVKTEKTYRVERAHGAFSREILLPAGVDSEAIRATYRDGLLEVRLPKRPEAKPREVKIEKA
jgi:HSP20 family protein